MQQPAGGDVEDIRVKIRYYVEKIAVVRLPLVLLLIMTDDPPLPRAGSCSSRRHPSVRGCRPARVGRPAAVARPQQHIHDEEE